ncbi:MAG: TonB-dependent receptor plug domain-containing protein [Cyclobacteriaceae bacterium]|nr:TonB-dependent receptor plug domain-containing protein [Cyclobacteriaceae bacterium]
MKIPGLFLLAICSLSAFGQPQDSVKVLQEITIRSYEADRPLLEVPASVGLFLKEDLQRFNNTSLVSAVNTLPGVRMEERSPGSYRFSIRGSSLRAPFGVRNVKVYWNELPLTDAGGNTYLNQLDANTIQQMEIIKGPGSSLYGAGTGGVLLLKSPQTNHESALTSSFLGGSYGLRNYQLALNQGGKNSSHYVGYQHQQADGYREQTRMARDQLTSTFRFSLSDKEQLETAIFYTDLYYQTPGGLTLPEYNTNPRQARPAAGVSPGAVEQNASVSLRSFYTGVSHQYHFSKNFHNRTGVFGNFVQFNNAAIRNYEHRAEQNFGVRSVTDFSFAAKGWQVRLIGGGEYLNGFSPIKTYQNLQGIPGALQSDDELRIHQYSLFGQTEISKENWLITGGLSANWVEYKFQRLSNTPPAHENTDFKPVLTPRIALLRKINAAFSTHGSLSWGFSPPTLAEVRPSNTVFNKNLQSEKGIQAEVGARGYFGKRKFFIDAAFYHFELTETIVVRRDEDGADYFVNAGATNQNGLELLLNWQTGISAFSTCKVWAGLTLNDYTFKEYAKDNISYNGNTITGVPDRIITGGVDFEIRKHLYGHITVNYTSSLPLDDANTALAPAYTLLGCRAGYKFNMGKKLPLDFFAGGDNLLNQKYSLGNDLNAAGARFYNAAPGRNYFIGLIARLDFSRNR